MPVCAPNWGELPSHRLSMKPAESVHPELSAPVSAGEPGARPRSVAGNGGAGDRAVSPPGTAARLHALRQRIGTVVVGQQHLVDRLIIALLCRGHVLVEGVPGIAKTLTISTLAASIEADYARIQFTPDLLPGDLTGSLIYRPQTGDFVTRRGPIFANIVLADEVNRAPAKVQSALLEAMQERQVTIGDTSHQLPDPFLVLATQNPIEQEGTYELPEAQLDRFFFKVRVDYPAENEELEIMRRMARARPQLTVKPVLTSRDILELQESVDGIHLHRDLEHLILNLVRASRETDLWGADLDQPLRHGASPRASIQLSLAARAHALMQGRDYATPADISAVAHDVLRHRIGLSYRAEVEGWTSDRVVEKLLTHFLT